MKIASSTGALGVNIDTRSAPEKIFEKLEKKFANVLEVKETPFDLESTNEEIYKKALKALEKKSIFLGGDHSITYPLFRAFSAAHNNPAIIVFDAHTDCRSWTGNPSNASYLRALIERNFVKSENVLLVGVRAILEEEKKFIEKWGIRTIPAEDVKRNIKETKKRLKNFAKSFQNIYLSIDIDFLGPKSLAPTQFSVEKGLNRNELIDLVEMLLSTRNVKALDFVEVNPAKDADEQTIKFIAKFVEKILGEGNG